MNLLSMIAIVLLAVTFLVFRFSDFQAKKLQTTIPCPKYGVLEESAVTALEEVGQGGKIRTEDNKIELGEQEASAIVGKDVMNLADLDQDERLEAAEISQLLSKLHLPQGDDWRELDSNRDGWLSTHELDDFLITYNFSRMYLLFVSK